MTAKRPNPPPAGTDEESNPSLDLFSNGPSPFDAGAAAGGESAVLPLPGMEDSAVLPLPEDSDSAVPPLPPGEETSAFAIAVDGESAVLPLPGFDDQAPGGPEASLTGLSSLDLPADPGQESQASSPSGALDGAPGTTPPAAFAEPPPAPPADAPPAEPPPAAEGPRAPPAARENSGLKTIINEYMDNLRAQQEKEALRQRMLSEEAMRRNRQRRLMMRIGFYTGLLIGLIGFGVGGAYLLNQKYPGILDPFKEALGFSQTARKSLATTVGRQTGGRNARQLQDLQKKLAALALAAKKLPPEVLDAESGRRLCKAPVRAAPGPAGARTTAGAPVAEAANGNSDPLGPDAAVWLRCLQDLGQHESALDALRPALPAMINRARTGSGQAQAVALDRLVSMAIANDTIGDFKANAGLAVQLCPEPSVSPACAAAFHLGPATSPVSALFLKPSPEQSAALRKLDTLSQSLVAYRRGRVAFEKGEPEKALGFLKRGLRILPKASVQMRARITELMIRAAFHAGDQTTLGVVLKALDRPDPAATSTADPLVAHRLRVLALTAQGLFADESETHAFYAKVLADRTVARQMAASPVFTEILGVYGLAFAENEAFLGWARGQRSHLGKPGPAHARQLTALALWQTRHLMALARWPEAAKTLAGIPKAFEDATGVNQLRATIPFLESKGLTKGLPKIIAQFQREHLLYQSWEARYAQGYAQAFWRPTSDEATKTRKLLAEDALTARSRKLWLDLLEIRIDVTEARTREARAKVVAFRKEFPKSLAPILLMAAPDSVLDPEGEWLEEITPERIAAYWGSDEGMLAPIGPTAGFPAPAWVNRN